MKKTGKGNDDENNWFGNAFLFEDLFFEDFSSDDGDDNNENNTNAIKSMKNIGEENCLQEQQTNKAGNSKKLRKVTRKINNNNNEINFLNENFRSMLCLHRFQNYVNQPRNCSLEQFIEFMNYKINGEKNKKVTKETLMYTYKLFQKYMNLENLTRSEKRNKVRIYEKMFPFYKIVMFCFEKIPDYFLNPILLFINKKRNSNE